MIYPRAGACLEKPASAKDISGVFILCLPHGSAAVKSNVDFVIPRKRQAFEREEGLIDSFR